MTYPNTIDHLTPNSDQVQETFNLKEDVKNPLTHLCVKLEVKTLEPSTTKIKHKQWKWIARSKKGTNAEDNVILGKWIAMENVEAEVGCFFDMEMLGTRKKRNVTNGMLLFLDISMAKAGYQPCRQQCEC